MKRISFRTPSKGYSEANLHEDIKEHSNESLKIQRRLEKNSGKVFFSHFQAPKIIICKNDHPSKSKLQIHYNHNNNYR